MVARILLADDHQIVREGLKSLLNSHEDMEVVGEARDGRSAVQMAKDLTPDVVIMDVGMPHLNGIEATRQITAREPEAKVVAPSMHADRRSVGERSRGGATGDVWREGGFEQLPAASRRGPANKRSWGRRGASVRVEHYAARARGGSGGVASAVAGATPRAGAVLQLVGEGR